MLLVPGIGDSGLGLFQRPSKNSGYYFFGNAGAMGQMWQQSKRNFLLLLACLNFFAGYFAKDFWAFCQRHLFRLRLEKAFRVFPVFCSFYVFLFQGCVFFFV